MGEEATTARQVTVSERLDSLPLSGAHWKLVAVCGLGWLFDAMDSGIISFVLAALMKKWALTNGQVGWIASAGLIGMFAGALVSGRIADRVGRKYLFQATLLLFSVATGLCALATGYRSLLILRFLVGFGLGGELPVASTLVTEFAPAKHRGKLLVILESFWAFGWTVAAIVSFLVIPRFPEYGWKLAFLVGFLPAFYIFYLRRGIPESPRYLASHGRMDEAGEAIRWLQHHHQPQPSPDSLLVPDPARTLRKTSWLSLWTGKYTRRTLMLWLLWFSMIYSYYGIFTWLPSLLVRTGHPLVQTFEFVLIITLAQVPGYFSAALLVDRLGRKPTLAAYMIGCAISAFLFGHAASPAQILFYGCLISFFNLGAWGVVYSYTPELYPTEMRGTGAGTAAAIGRTGGILAPFVVAHLLASGQNVVFVHFAAVVVVGALAVILLGEETKQRRLEEI